MILNIQFLQNFMAGFLHYCSTRIVVLVNSVTEAHQSERIVLVFRPCDKFRDSFNTADGLKHSQTCLVGTAVSRTPQCSNTGGNTCIRVGTGWTGKTDWGGWRVLLVICVQNEDPVHCLFQNWIYNIRFARCCKHHVQEVSCIAQIVLRVHERLTFRIFVGHGSQSRDLGQQTDCHQFAILRIGNVNLLVIERGKSSRNTAHDRHRVGISSERLEQLRDLFVNHGVVWNLVLELGQLSLVR